MQVQKRKFNPYEQNQLLKYGINLSQFSAENQVPVEYLTGYVHFCGLDFKVSPAVLIPRVETEELVELVTEEFRNWPKDRFLHIIDVGTGSGALGVAVYVKLHEFLPDVELTLSDISPAALKIAHENASQLIGSSVKLLESDLLAQVPTQKFDLILANLPYIPSARIPTLDNSVREYEPVLALDGGPDGLVLIEKLLSQVPEFLAPQGKVFLEIDEFHTQEQLEHLTDLKVEILSDSFGKTRFAVAR